MRLTVYQEDNCPPINITIKFANPQYYISKRNKISRKTI